MKKIISILVVSLSAALFSQTAPKDTLTYIYQVEKLDSHVFKEERAVKVYLPAGYNENQKYPVLYALDGFALFDITVQYQTFLAKFDIVPHSIVVGIFHNNRGYETKPNYGIDVRIPVTEFLEGSEKLKNHLIEEVVPRIDELYSTSGFNTLIGHSNTATFVNEMISEAYNPFQGFVAMTPDLLKEQTDHLQHYLSKNNFDKRYYFVSSGLKDNQYRLETGKILDTVFQKLNRKEFLGLHKIYKAGHMDLVPKSLNDALMFVFSDYRNYDDFDYEVIKNNVPISKYLEQKINTSGKNYGINYDLSEEDFYHLLTLVIEEKDKHLLEELFDIGEQNEFFDVDHLYSSKAQYYEELGMYEEALKNWKLQIENGYFRNTFYFERPFKVLDEELNRPKEGIKFLQQAIETYPEGKLMFSYLIAKTSEKHQVKPTAGKHAITYCLEHFKTNRIFTLKEAKALKSRLFKN